MHISKIMKIITKSFVSLYETVLKLYRLLSFIEIILNKMSSINNWPKTDNFIKTAANRNYIGAKGIFSSFDERLFNGKDDADVLTYYDEFNPYFLTFSGYYSVWDSLRSSSPGNTLGVVQLIELLSGTKIKAWDIAIQVIYNNTTPQYKSLLPHHRTPFQSGQVDQRVSSLKNLLIAIGTDASLSTIKTNISLFLTQLNAAIALQHNQLIGINKAIVNLEASIDKAADIAFGIFGKFITKFAATPKLIDAYFPVNLLQNVVQLVFTATLTNQTPKEEFKRKLDISKQKIRGTNIGTETVNGYFTNGLTNLPEVGARMISMPPNSVDEYTLVEAGYTDLKRHFYVVNTGTTDATIIIEIFSEN